jgi:hypothetical protein
MIYGAKPVDCGLFDLKLSEVCYFLYLPIKLGHSYKERFPKQLNSIEPLFEVIREKEEDYWFRSYVYVTMKRMIIGPSISPNRPGWHSDGFMTNDTNYIWSDCLPTVFNDGPFYVDADHVKSLEQFEVQAHPNRNYTMPNKHLLKLNDKVIHRVDNPKVTEMRTFIKISLSSERYNLEGNSINHDLDYDWTYYSRDDIRNDPHKAQGDFK